VAASARLQGTRTPGNAGVLVALTLGRTRARLTRGAMRTCPRVMWTSRSVVEASNSLRHAVLHIRSGPASGVPIDPSLYPLDAVLASVSLDVDLCGDVYRGLARLLDADSTSTRAIVVRLDDLSPSELEFFSIVARLRRSVPVYVYGQPRSSALIAKAIELGAAGIATAETLRGLANRAQAAATPKCPVVDTVPRQPPPSTTVTLPKDDAERPVEESAAEPARVPWLRYSDRPVRGAPTDRESTAEVTTARSRTPVRAAAVEPLLTEAELQALMDDDFADDGKEDSPELTSDSERNERNVP